MDSDTATQPSPVSGRLSAGIRRRVLLLAAASALSACDPRPEQQDRKINQSEPVQSKAPVGKTDITEILDLARAGNGVVRLGEGVNYVLQRPLDVSGLNIIGRNARFTVDSSFQAGPGETSALTSRGTTAIDGLAVDIAPGAPPIDAITWYGNEGSLTLTNMHISIAVSAGIRFNAPEGATRAELNAKGVTVEGGAIGVQAEGCTAANLTLVVVRNASHNGIQLTRGRKLVAKECRAWGCGQHGILVMYWIGGALDKCVAVSNKAGGITLGGGDPTKEPNNAFLLTGCRADSNGLSGISLDTTIAGRPGQPVIINAEVTKSSARQNGIHGINVTSSSNVTLSNNVVSDNGRCGIGVSADAIAVTGNHASNNKSWGIGFFGRPRTPEQVGSILATNLFHANRLGDCNLPGASPAAKPKMS